jgi:hypothetical protein
MDSPVVKFLWNAAIFQGKNAACRQGEAPAEPL